MSRVLIIQRYVPGYRVPLFDALSVELAKDDIGLVVAHGRPRGSQAARGDAASATWAEVVPEMTLPLPGGLMPTWKRVRPFVAEADVVVAELASTSLNSWDLLLRHARKTILWGHGKSYVKRQGRLDAWAEQVMTRRAAHVMTYTATGREHLLAQGLSPSRVTAIGNSTDTRRLRDAFEQSAGDAAGWREKLGTAGPVGLFVGGLDTDKRIPFLLGAGRAASQIDPTFRLVVAGSGKDAALLERYLDESWLVRLPKVSPEEFASLAWVADAVWMPGRVGLVAVDALALGLPVMTTPFPFHAPEIDYLVPGESVHFLPDEPRAFAESAVRIMKREKATDSIATGEIPSAENVGRQMAATIREVIAS